MAVASKTWSVGEVVTAANKNTYERDNFSDLQAKKVVVKAGSYAGDGSTGQAITGVGFTPVALIITTRKTGDGNDIEWHFTSTPIVDDTATGGSIELSDSIHKFYAESISSLDADGFTVDDRGADHQPNKNGETYNYVAWGAE